MCPPRRSSALIVRSTLASMRVVSRRAIDAERVPLVTSADSTTLCRRQSCDDVRRLPVALPPLRVDEVHRRRSTPSVAVDSVPPDDAAADSVADGRSWRRSM